MSGESGLSSQTFKMFSVSFEKIVCLKKTGARVMCLLEQPFSTSLRNFSSASALLKKK